MRRPLVCLVLLVSLILGSCADASYWYARTFYGIDCRPESLTNGQCVPVKKGDPNAHDGKTAHP
jgi:hypothetical protein